jgi:hypothetical protein
VVKRLIRTANQNEEHQEAATRKLNLNELFDYVNSRKLIRANIVPLTSNQNTSLNSSADIATELNKFFTSVFAIEMRTSMHQLLASEHPLNTIECTTTEIRVKIGKLKAGKSAGRDGFIPRV